MFFKSEEPTFYNIASIRTAEMYVKFDNLFSARDILDPFEEASKFSSLILPFQALFLRINSEKYFALNQDEKALKYFSSAIELNRRECYNHQLMELDKLRLRYHKKLPNDFSVY